VVPLLIIAVLGTVIAFIAFSGYQTATASGFFALKDVDIRGIERTPEEDIRRIVTAGVTKAGVWNADLGEIREKLEKFPFVKSATVSRSLPSGMRVNITERTPAAVVSLSSGKYLVDDEGTMLTAVKGEQADFPVVLQGWDESKTTGAITDNIARLKMYRKMMEEWQQFDLSKRVREVNLANPRIPVAHVEDSGRVVGITLARDNFGRSLKTAIEALTGKGDRVKSIDAAGVYPVIQYLDF
jgi:cell division septal protein FtsQ